MNGPETLVGIFNISDDGESASIVLYGPVDDVTVGQLQTELGVPMASATVPVEMVMMLATLGTAAGLTVDHWGE